MVAAASACQYGQELMTMEPFDNDPMQDKEIRRILQEPLDGPQAWAEPGEEVWTGIEAALPDKRKRRFGGWWWLPLLAIMAVVAVGVLWNAASSNISATDLTAQTESNQLVPQENSSTEFSTTEILTSENPTSDNPDIKKSTSISTSESNKWSKTHTHANQDLKSTILANKESSSSDTQKSIDQKSHSSSNATTINDHLQREYTNTPIQPLLEKSIDAITDITANSGMPATKQALSTASKISEKRIPVLDLEKLPLLEVRLALKKIVLPPESKNQLETITPPVKKSSQRITTYVHGTGAGKDVRISGPMPNLDPVIQPKQSNIRFGLGYEYQTNFGFFAGSGIEYQQFSETSVREKEWIFTKVGSMPGGPNEFSQQFNLQFTGGLGSNSADIRVSIGQQQNTVDYQEGDPVHLKLTVEQQLRQVRVPLYIGYRLEKKSWFAEIRGGVGLNVQISYNAELTRLLETRNRIKLLAQPPLPKPKNLQSTYWDMQGGIYAGYKVFADTELSVGYEVWRSLESVVDHPKFKTYLNGSGLYAGVRWTF